MSSAPPPPAGALLADLAGVLRSMWDRLPPQSAAMVLHSYAHQQFTPHELLDAAAEHLAARLDDYEPQVGGWVGVGGGVGGGGAGGG